MRWLISVVCLVLLGTALMAAAQTPAAGSSAAPTNVQIVKTLGENSLDTTTVTGRQTEIWVNWTPPVQQFNSSPIDYQLSVSSSDSTQKAWIATCAQLTGQALCYGSIIRYFDQAIVPGNTYTISVATVNAYGPGAAAAAATTAKAPYNGNPATPTNLVATYQSSTSFLLTFAIPQFQGQTGPSAVTQNNQLLSPFFEVQIKVSTGNWWPTNCSWASGPIPFQGTTTCVVQWYTTDATPAVTQYLTPSTTYSLRARAVGQWGYGLWSNAGINISATTGALSVNSGVPTLTSAATIGSTQSPNEVNSSGLTNPVKSANGGVVAWTALPNITGSVSSGGSNATTITGWSVWIAPKCQMSGQGGACAGGQVNVSNTDWVAGTALGSSSTQLITNIGGRVVGGSAWITNAKGSGANPTATAGDTWWVSLTANSASTDNSGTGARQWNSASIGALTIATAQSTTDAAGSIVSCWAINAGSTSCIYNFTAQPTVVNSNAAGPIAPNNGGFASATPYTVTNSSDLTTGTSGTISSGALTAVSPLGATVQNAAIGSFTITAVSANFASPKILASVLVAGASPAATVVSNGIGAPADQSAANITAAAVPFLKRDGTVATGVADGVLAAGTDFVVLNVSRPAFNGSFPSGTTLAATGLPAFLSNGSGIDFFVGANNAISYANSVPALASKVLATPASNSPANADSLSAASFVVAVQTDIAGTNTRFGFGVANTRVLGINSVSQSIYNSTNLYFSTVPTATPANPAAGAPGTAGTIAVRLNTATATNQGVAVLGAGFAAGANYVGNLCLISVTVGTGYIGFIKFGAAGSAASSVINVAGGSGYTAASAASIGAVGVSGCTAAGGAAPTLTPTVAADGSVTIALTSAGGATYTGQAAGGGSLGFCDFSITATGTVPTTPATGYLQVDAGAFVNNKIFLVNGGVGFGAGSTIAGAQITHGCTGGDGNAVVATAVTLGNSIASIAINNPGAAYAASASNVIISVPYGAAPGGVSTIRIGTYTTPATAGQSNYGAGTSAFFACCANSATGAAVTFASNNTNGGTSVSVVDVSDTAANLLFSTGNTTFNINAAYGSGLVIGSTVANAWTVQTADSASVPAISQPASGAACTSSTGNFLAYDGYTCQIGTLVPGRQYTLQTAVTLQTSNVATAQTTSNISRNNSAGLGAGVFYTATSRPAAAITSGSKGAYFIGTTTATIYFQTPTTTVGQGALSSYTLSTGNNWSASSPITSQVTAAPTGQNQTQIQIVGALAAAGTSLTANGTTTNAGDWGTLQVRGLTASTANNTYSYTVRVYLANNINTNIAGTAVTTFNAQIANTAPAAPTLTTANNVRFITTTSAWIEWEAPVSVGTDLAGAVALSQYSAAIATGSSCTGTPALSDINGSALTPLGSSGAVYHFNQAIVSGLVSSATGTCAITLTYTNTANTAGNQAGTASSSISIALVNGATTAPAIPTPLAVPFDQVFSASAVVGYTIPNTWGGGSTSATVVNLGAGSPTFAFTVTGGAATTSTTAQRGTQSLANDGTTNQGYGFIPSRFNGLFNIYTGAYQQIIGTSVTTGGVTTNTPLAANTAYTVSITATFTAGANAPVSQPGTTAAQRTNRLGDVPDAPTNVAVTRVTNTSARLTFTKPINVGGDELCAAAGGGVANPCAVGSQFTLPFRAYYIQGTVTGGSLPTNIATAVTGLTASAAAGPYTFYSTASYPVANGATQPWYGPRAQAGFLTFTQSYFVDITAISSTTSTNITFYVCADNQFSAGFGTGASATFVPAGCAAGNTNTNCVAGTTYNALTCNPSTGVAQTLPAATATPGSTGTTTTTSVAVTQYGWNFIVLSFNGPQLWGGTGTAATYTLSRSTAADGTFVVVGNANVAYASIGDQFTVVDSSLTVPNGAATQFFYKVVFQTSNTLQTTTTFNTTTQATGDAPLAPAAPTITASAVNAYAAGVNTGYSPNIVQDVVTNITWTLPLGIGGTTVNSMGAFQVTQTVAQQTTGSATPSAPRNLPNCITTYTWQNSATTTDLVKNASFSTIPGKSYTYAVTAINFTNPAQGATAQYNPSPASGGLKQAAYPIVAPYPAPSLAASAIGAGYVTFTVTFPNNYNLGLAYGTQYGSPNAGGSTVLQPTTLYDDSFPAPAAGTALNAYTGLQLLQQSNVAANANATAFAPDTFVPFQYGTVASGATTAGLSVNGLNGATNYRFSALAFNGYFFTQAATAVTVKTLAATTPGAVITLNSNQQRRTGSTSNPSIWLQWAQPLETGGEGFVSNWTIKYGLSASTSNSTQSVTNNSRVVSAVVNSNLSDNTRYYITVQGSNSKGTSAVSSFAGSVTDNGASNIVRTGQIPYEPTSFTVSGNTGSTVDFTWVLPSNAAAINAITGGAGSLAITNQVIVGSAALAVLSGSSQVPASVTYSSPGITQPSSTSATTTATGSITVQNGGFYRFSIYNTNPLNNASGVAAGTSVNLSLGVYLQAATSTSTTVPVPAAVTSFQLDYTAITEYRVSFLPTAGTTTVAAATFFYVIYWQQITRFSANQNNPSVNDGGNTNVVVTAWSTVTLALNSNPSTGNIAYASCAQIFNAIRPSSKYNMVVIPANSNGIGAMTPSAGTNGVAQPLQPANATPGPQPSAPDAPSQTANPTDSTISIGWATPSNQGLAQIQYYIVQATPSNGGNGNKVTMNVPSSAGTSRLNYNSTVNGLSSGTQYDMNVTGYNSFGQGTPSASTQITTTGNAGFAAASSLWTVVLMAVAALFAFAF